MPDWYYKKDDKDVGPLSNEAMEEKIRDGEIEPDTYIWNNQISWIKAKKSGFSNIFSALQLDQPLFSSKKPGIVSNTLIWILVFLPLLDILLLFILEALVIRIQDNVWLLYSITTVFLLFILDRIKLREANYDTPSAWTILFIPIYLWKRSTILAQKRFYFWTYIITRFAFYFLWYLASVQA